LANASALSFTRDAAGYDAMRRKLVPCFDDFYGTALDLIGDWRRPGPFRALDLGAGTGLFAAMVAGRFPDAEMTLLDASEGMLQEARKRFAANPAVRFVTGDMAAGPIGGPFDLVISALAIHHLEDRDKKALFARIAKALTPGGLFVNAEQVLGPTPALERRYAEKWLGDVRALGAPEDEIAKAQERMRHDRSANVGDQLGWMADAGLADVDCSFKAWRFAVLSGRKPE
jgi:ubiquinone/menaquinone biosynthesis C-methylase UbiE